MESQPQNSEYLNNPENVYPYDTDWFENQATLTYYKCARWYRCVSKYFSSPYYRRVLYSFWSSAKSRLVVIAT